jgi:Sec-independent protein translocase protein TatA
VPDQPPRRRITDNDRRRWNDKALDLLGERVESHAQDIEEVRAELRAVSRLPAEMAALSRAFDTFREDVKEDNAETRKDIRELRAEDRAHFERNFREHREVKKTADEIAQTVKPSRLDWAVKFATIISFLLIPILAAYVASGH